ncbi:hypothetical protein IMCC12053_1316 [Celeribacter marinus]|uniref:Uncharacterized protein n=1 Tax=Celeribacter marinus TaxID=1397108 RepID=A0A0P0A9H8_9RHOB|nr:hypothetical protein IMCC12053_1316 [Celeribacter marinus]
MAVVFDIGALSPIDLGAQGKTTMKKAAPKDGLNQTVRAWIKRRIARRWPKSWSR